MAQRFCLLDIDYVIEQHRPVVRLWGADEQGKAIVLLDRSFEPYFYADVRQITEQQEEELLRRVLALSFDGRNPRRVERTERTFLGKQTSLIKITVPLPTDVDYVRDIVKTWDEIKGTYEHTIPFSRRYLIDKGLLPLAWYTVTGKPIETALAVDIAVALETLTPQSEEHHPSFRIIAFDIETIDRDGTQEIIMISLKDTAGFETVISYGKQKQPKGVPLEIVEDEAAMIARFVKHITERRPHIIVGYNSDRFDFPQLQRRAQTFGIPLDLGADGSPIILTRRGRSSAALIRGRLHIDLFDFVERVLGTTLESEVHSLDRVAKEILGVGKIPLEWKDIERAWRDKDLATVARYCLMDSELALRLAETLLPQIYELSRVVGQSPFDTSRMFYSQMVEWLLIRNAFTSKELVPNRPPQDEIKKRHKVPAYTGGYVHQPTEGMYENITVFDFASLYPTITITHNISPETLDCQCCGKHKEENPNMVPGQDHFYCRDHKGFVVHVLEDLLARRRALQARPSNKVAEYRQHAFKLLANASYGYYAYPGSRWYSRVCAESIASFGRMYIKQVITLAIKEGYHVIYGDTDSLFLQMKTEKKIQPFMKIVNTSLPGIMEIECKGFYTAGLFVLAKTGVAAKKRYALIAADGTITIRGFEKVRRDWSVIAKDTQEAVLRAILAEKDPKKATSIVRTTVEALKEGTINKDHLVIYSQLTRPLSQYEQIGPHVAAAKKLVQRGGRVHEGTVIGYIITPGTGTISERAEPVEDATRYDAEYYIHNQVIPAALRVLSGLGITEDDLLHDTKRQYSLSGFLQKPK
ncbi:MAG: DNA-directed DNA polymerase [Nanoarchaeota archaeon]|nr:DNA-directed DNA polymerase [Nanoarchaeota archaeon]